MNRFSNYSDEIATLTTNNAESNDGVTRRRFMTLLGGGVASLSLQGCGGEGDIVGDAPQAAAQLPLLVIGGSTPKNGAVVASFQLNSVSGGNSMPFTVGHAFKKGHVPSGTYLSGSIPELQIIPKNNWPDGSLKFAIVSGRASLVAGTPLTVNLVVGSRNTSAPLTTENLRVTGVTASIGASGYGTVSWTPADWASPFTAWVSGPFMSSWLYRKPIGTDGHLVAWLEVRLYRGGAVEVLPWIENGYLRVAQPTSKSANFSFSLGNTQRFAALIELPNHTRTVLVSGAIHSHWLGTAPQITPNHDKVYLQLTGLVPTYNVKVDPAAPIWSGLAKTYQPLQQSNYSNSMGSAGYSPSIGILPEWDTLYLTSDDLRAYAGVIVNAYSAGRFGIHYRDEKTLRPLRFSNYPNLVVSGGSGISSSGASTNSSYTPTPSGTSPSVWSISHHPSIGFMAYLLTGRYYFMEEVQFSATANYLTNTDSTRQFSAGVFLSHAGSNTTRGAGWALRTLAQAACITPDDDALRPEFLTSLAANVEYYHSTYVAKKNNALGIVAPYSNYTAGQNKYSEAAWMQDFFTAAVGYAIDLDPGVGSAAAAKLSAFFNWKAQSVVGRLGGTSQNEFLYRDAAQYTLCVAPSDKADFVGGTGPWFANWGEVYTATLGVANTAGDGPLRGGNFPEATSYWGNLMPAIAYAVRHKVPGAAEAYARLTKASNWNQLSAGFVRSPVWGIAPGASSDTAPVVVPPPATTEPTPGIPAWVPPVGYFADVPMLNNPQDVTPAIYPARAMDEPFIMWGGSAILRDYSPLGAQVYYAGGHEASGAQANVQLTLICDFSTLTWNVANVPKQANLSSNFYNGYAADGTPYTPHTYLGLQEFPKAWGGGSKGSLISFFQAGNGIEKRIHFMDVSAATMGYKKLETRQPQNNNPTKISFGRTSAGGDYPITVMDNARRGWWVAANGGADFTLFVSNTGEITQYPALGGNLASGSMVLCDSLNLLIAIDGGYKTGLTHRSLYIRDLATGNYTTSLVAGSIPGVGNGYDGSINTFYNPDSLGLQWVDELGCIVGLDQSVSPPAIVKLTPPASNPATGTWTWSTVPVSHWNQDQNGRAVLQPAVNNMWSKFRWVPSLHAFVYATSRSTKPQVVRIK